MSGLSNTPKPNDSDESRKKLKNIHGDSFLTDSNDDFPPLKVHHEYCDREVEAMLLCEEILRQQEKEEKSESSRKTYEKN
ncbi:hypothetical protein BDZ97DRAFT_1788878 [Flammula alnicola]|nr:hypothetical protein BDZ97DRAFT_1788878 [Flammula alnicola]